MSIMFRSTELSSAEASFLKWQYGFDEEDEPFERALWQITWGRSPIDFVK